MTPNTNEEPRPLQGSLENLKKCADDANWIYRTLEFFVEPASLPQCKTILAAFLRNVRRSEPRTIHYISYEDLRDPTHFLHVMAFADRGALETHVSSLAHRLFLSDLGTMLRRPMIVTDLSLFDTR